MQIYKTVSNTVSNIANDLHMMNLLTKPNYTTKLF